MSQRFRVALLKDERTLGKLSQAAAENAPAKFADSNYPRFSGRFRKKFGGMVVAHDDCERS